MRTTLNSSHARHRCFPALLLALTLGISLPAFSATLFSTLGQSQNGNSNFTGGIIASDFTTGSDGSILTGLTLGLAKTYSSNVDVTASIYTDAGGNPGISLGSFSTITVPGNATFGQTINYSATTAGISLAAGTNYWLGFTIGPGSVGTPYNNANGVDAGSLFNTVSATQWKQSFNGGSSWSNSNSGNFIYSLAGTVAAPEPGRTVLLFSGLGLMLFRRRRV